MFDDYDTTSCNITYNSIFNIKFNEDIEVVYSDIIKNITEDTKQETISESSMKEIKMLLQKGKSGLGILDSRYVSNISLRFCYYTYPPSTPKWYLFIFWNR
jgi:hypothetical protein